MGWFVGAKSQNSDITRNWKLKALCEKYAGPNGALALTQLIFGDLEKDTGNQLKDLQDLDQATITILFSPEIQTQTTADGLLRHTLSDEIASLYFADAQRIPEAYDCVLKICEDNLLQILQSTMVN